MGADSFHMLALSATAAFLNVVIGAGAAPGNFAAFLAGLFRVAAVGLLATVVGLRAAAEEGPFSPGLNFALVASLVALGAWSAWTWLETPAVAEEPSDDDSSP
jgi:hypothetical protein